MVAAGVVDFDIAVNVIIFAQTAQGPLRSKVQRLLLLLPGLFVLAISSVIIVVAVAVAVVVFASELTKGSKGKSSSHGIAFDISNIYSSSFGILRPLCRGLFIIIIIAVAEQQPLGFANGAFGGVLNFVHREQVVREGPVPLDFVGHFGRLLLLLDAHSGIEQHVAALVVVQRRDSSPPSASCGGGGGWQ